MACPLYCAAVHDGNFSAALSLSLIHICIGRRRIWEPETLPKDIRRINSHYDDLYRIPDGGVIQVDYPDGRSFTARVEHLDDYHFDMGGLGNV